MTVYQWFVFFLIVQLIHFLGTWKMYIAAGRKAWEAGIPIYNCIVLMKIIKLPTWYTILLFIPIVNLIMFPVVWIETLRSFKKDSTLDSVLAVFTLGFYIYYVNYTQKLEYITDKDFRPSNIVVETINSVAFALIVATIVHTYVMQPFQIPTASLEKTLLVGDFLMVSKLHYGARPQMTAVALPMIHDTIPLTKQKSYESFPQFPYFRFPAFQKIKNNDIVVFNWPVDTVYFFRDPSGRHIDKPIDKKSNYVKRCVGIAGDSLEIKNGIVFINNKELILPERAKPQYTYQIYSKKGIDLDLVRAAGSTEYDRTFEVVFENNEQIDYLQQKRLISFIDIVDKSKNLFKIKTSEAGIPAADLKEIALTLNEVNDYQVKVNLTFKGAEELRANKSIDSVVRNIARVAEYGKNGVFPHNKNWNRDNFGPIYIPQEGKTVALNTNSLPFYERIIKEYEHNDLKVEGNTIKINGQIATTYTFKQDYFWMMGDNRHNSEDSRYWGYVPADHIVGKPTFIWMSLDPNGKGFNKIRWSRLFTTVSGDGEPQSYFKLFLGLLALYFVGEHFWNKRKTKV
jgi:signal peptidase I